MIHKDEIGYKILSPIVKTYFRLKFKPTVYGKENIPQKGAVIFCGNHKHTHDQFNVMVVTNRPIHYLAKDEYFKKWYIAWFFKMACCIPVDRTKKDANAKSRAGKVLERGSALGIFPEGTRNKTLGTKDEVDLLPFKFGAVSLAKKHNALIVPFGISGEYTGKKGKLTTRIGKPIDVSDMSLEEANEVLRKNILKLMKKTK
jgi:1-acyl-sn-glycerol-3-phosphate acyltransferase